MSKCIFCECEERDIDCYEISCRDKTFHVCLGCDIRNNITPVKLVEVVTRILDGVLEKEMRE